MLRRWARLRAQALLSWVSWSHSAHRWVGRAQRTERSQSARLGARRRAAPVHRLHAQPTRDAGSTRPPTSTAVGRCCCGPRSRDSQRAGRRALRASFRASTNCWSRSIAIASGPASACQTTPAGSMSPPVVQPGGGGPSGSATIDEPSLESTRRSREHTPREGPGGHRAGASASRADCSAAPRASEGAWGTGIPPESRIARSTTNIC